MFEKINEDLTKALKDGDKFRLSVLRMVKSALQLESINKKSELTDDDVYSVLKKQIKQRKDSIGEYEKLNETETVESLKKEVEIINSYLPEEATEEEIDKTIDNAFSEINPQSMKDMGLVMKYVKEHLNNFDSSIVSSKIKERLNK